MPFAHKLKRSKPKTRTLKTQNSATGLVKAGVGKDQPKPASAENVVVTKFEDFIGTSVSPKSAPASPKSAPASPKPLGHEGRELFVEGLEPASPKNATKAPLGAPSQILSPHDSGRATQTYWISEGAEGQVKQPRRKSGYSKLGKARWWST
jgi:hypothetical protein